VGYVYPAGGKQGTTFQIIAGGQNLEGVTNVFVSGAGARGVVVDFNRPMSQGQFNNLRDELKELTDKRMAANKTKFKRGSSGGASAANTSWTATDERKFEELRAKIMKNPPNRNANPAISDVATIQVTLDADAAPGEREIRMGTPNGLSNPMLFFVSRLNEFTEKPFKNSLEGRIGKPRKTKEEFPEHTSAADPPVPITIPAVVNGQIMPGDADRVKFFARKGQRLVVAASARELIPYLPDAVPGWFQATLSLYDARGKELAYDDDFQFHPDPVIYYEVPKDGEYIVQIKDAIYRGREDFIYRLTIGELPFVTGIFPLGGPVGKPTEVVLKGWNLQATNLIYDAKDQTPGLVWISLGQKEKMFNQVPFMVSELPECLEQEPNNSPGAAQLIKLPIIVNGRIDKPGEADVFRFEGKAGQDIVAEVYARRLDSPLDSVLRLTDSAGKVIAANDDHEDKGSGLTTHHADSRIAVKLPADGVYYLHLADTQRKGGNEYAYRLRVCAPMPDFDLRIVPASINVRGGGTVPLTIYALRKDGCSEEIALSLKGAPAGFILNGATVPANEDLVRITITAPAFATRAPLSLTLLGRAKVQGKEVVRQAVPAEDMMQAFAYRHLVPAQDLEVAVTGKGMNKSSIRLMSETPIRIPLGGTARVQAGVPSTTYFGKIHLELNEPPEGITIKDIHSAGYGTELVFTCDASKAKVGQKGNLIVNVLLAKNEAATKTKSLNSARRAPVGTLPAIPFEIVEQKSAQKIVAK
jgi:hypothetical protein